MLRNGRLREGKFLDNLAADTASLGEQKLDDSNADGMTQGFTHYGQGVISRRRDEQGCATGSLIDSHS